MLSNFSKPHVRMSVGILLHLQFNFKRFGVFTTSFSLFKNMICISPFLHHLLYFSVKLYNIFHEVLHVSGENIRGMLIFVAVTYGIFIIVFSPVTV